MEPVSIRDLRKRLGEVVDAAQRGETVAITRRGEKVACIGPVAANGQQLPDLADFRASLKVTGEPLSRVVVELREAERG